MGDISVQFTQKAGGKSCVNIPTRSLTISDLDDSKKCRLVDMNAVAPMKHCLSGIGAWSVGYTDIAQPH